MAVTHKRGYPDLTFTHLGNRRLVFHQHCHHPIRQLLHHQHCPHPTRLLLQHRVFLTETIICSHLAGEHSHHCRTRTMNLRDFHDTRALHAVWKNRSIVHIPCCMEMVPTCYLILYSDQQQQSRCSHLMKRERYRL